MRADCGFDADLTGADGTGLIVDKGTDRSGVVCWSCIVTYRCEVHKGLDGEQLSAQGAWISAATETLVELQLPAVYRRPGLRSWELMTDYLMAVVL